MLSLHLLQNCMISERLITCALRYFAAHSTNVGSTPSRRCEPAASLMRAAVEGVSQGDPLDRCKAYADAAGARNR